MAETMEQAARVGLTWEEVCADPNLENLPYKIETNEWGQIVMSPTRLRHGGFQAEIAPEICVEILSPRNSKEEIEQKKQLYFDAGAQEVWICNEEGAMLFFNTETALKVSALVPGFPKKVED